MLALREYALKVSSRCNLDCDYCYVYTGPDQTWRAQPVRMSHAVMAATARRIGQHAQAHGLRRVRVALHGGEPLLAGPAAVEDLITSIRAAMPAGTNAELAVQTNGVLLDERYLRIFARHRVRVGISLDGTRQANDRHRRRADGRSSHADVTRALSLLAGEPYRPLFAAILCTIDLANDPVETYRALAAYRPPFVDFLLPHADWSRPPPRHPGAGAAPYADWLIAVFDEWYANPAPATRIRLFEEMLQLILGGSSGTESVGGAPLVFAIVQSDGGIEAADSLRNAYPGAASTGTSVLTHSFDEALRQPVFVALQSGPDALCDTCRSCPVIAVCGGGQYGHRYRAGTGFANPSVYCADMRRLIGHVARRVHADLGDRRDD
jgi:uncharacterized protein